MFLFFIQVILIIYIIVCVYSIIEIKKYNKNGVITEINDSKKIKDELLLLNPIKINFNSQFTYENLYNDYFNKNFINEGKTTNLNKINEYNDFIIYKNSDINDKYNLNTKINFDLSVFEDFPIPLLLYKKYSLSFLKGNIKTDKIFCKYNVNIIYLINGQIKLYLFNPKHKEDIMNKDLDSIKKYSHNYILKQNDLLIIPPNWYYILENDNKESITTIYNIDASNIFTFHYNYLR